MKSYYFIMFVAVAAASITNNDEPCVCILDGYDYPKVTTFDGQTIHIKAVQMSRIAVWRATERNQCIFRLRAVTIEKYGAIVLGSVIFCVGNHPNPDELHSCFNMDGENITLRGDQVEGNNASITVPYESTLETKFKGMDVHVQITGKKGSYILSSNDCSYKLVLKKNADDISVSFMFLNNGGNVVRGMCGDCNGVQDDYSLCDHNRTDVSTDPDKYTLISKSCAIPVTSPVVYSPHLPNLGHPIP